MELQKIINEACLLFNEAEKKIKYIEMIGEDLPIPAINELRYAGCHMTRAWSHQNGPEGLEEVNKAIKHGKRANYDAVEIGLLYYLEHLRQFQDDYRMIEIPSSFPEYIELCNGAEQVNQMILNRNSESRGDFWETIYTQFQGMEGDFKKLKFVRTELNKKLEIKQQETRRYRQNMTVAVLAIVVALVIGTFSTDIREFCKNTSEVFLSSLLKDRTNIERNTLLTADPTPNNQTKKEVKPSHINN